MDDGKIRKARILVVVKAYPNPSKGYKETVCTAGLLEGRRWIRIYPVPYRFLANSEQYPKFGWIEVDLERRGTDFRPESHHLLRGDQEQIRLLGWIPTTEAGWEERKRLVLQNVYTSMQALIADAYGPNCVSLAVLKPREILDVTWSAQHYEEDLEARNLEQDLFQDDDPWPEMKPVRRLPYRFYYQFTTDDGKLHQLMIEDWEIGALYWNCVDRSKDEKDAIEKVRSKYLELANETNLFLILGTTFVNHRKRFTNPFVIVGVFYPPKALQYSLFEDPPSS